MAGESEPYFSPIIKLERRSTPDALRGIAANALEIGQELTDLGLTQIAEKQTGIALALETLAGLIDDEHHDT